eukprot:97929-Chlamydomonas_euryale.AAC.1
MGGGTGSDLEVLGPGTAGRMLDGRRNRQRSGSSGGCSTRKEADSPARLRLDLSGGLCPRTLGLPQRTPNPNTCQPPNRPTIHLQSIVFVPIVRFPGMSWLSDDKLFHLEYSATEDYSVAGSGYAMLALAWPGVAFTLVGYGAAAERDYLSGSVLQLLQVWTGAWMRLACPALAPCSCLDL